MSEFDLPSPPSNPEFDYYDKSFRDLIDGRMQRGIRLREERDAEARRALRSVQAKLRA